MQPTRRRIRLQARPALLWTLVFFLAGHLLLGLYLHRRHLEFCDPEFSFRLRDLRARLAEAPGQPLALVVGSSRMAYGLRPDSAMQQTSGDDAKAVLFNLALLGVGPVGEQLVLHRVVSMGMKPKWLFVEVWPPFLPQIGFSNEQDAIFRRDVYWSDLSMIARLYHRRAEAAGRVFAESITPLLHYRSIVLSYYAPDLSKAPFIVGAEPIERLQTALDAYGWMPFPIERPDPSANAIHIERARLVTKPLFDKFRVSDISDQALHAILEECRANDIRVALLLAPEHSLLRSWYPPMQPALTAYLRGLSEDYGAPVIDARAWCGDDEFPDCCHLSPRGARHFSECFGRQVYRPLVDGRPLAKDILLCDPSVP